MVIKFVTLLIRARSVPLVEDLIRMPYPSGEPVPNGHFVDTYLWQSSPGLAKDVQSERDFDEEEIVFEHIRVALECQSAPVIDALAVTTLNWRQRSSPP
jgi:hypothetical protein